jgi:MoxR-like ATPase
MSTEIAPEIESIQRLRDATRSLREQIGRRVIGQTAVVDDILISLLARGNCLIVGVPGLAKTLLVRTLAEILDLRFSRIQFTPDLMPSDITGTEIIEENPATRERSFVFIPGPLFGQLILADEINRTPPKTQAALLEAMQEGHVTVSGKTYLLEQPFFVLATQNPIEQEGTYPLPEAQLDRFMFSLRLDYPSFEEEVEILKTTTVDETPEVRKVMTAAELIDYQRVIRKIPVPPSVAEYAVRLVQATRPGAGEKSPLAAVHRYIRWGAGPRASQYLALAGKVLAVLDGRYNVAVEDIQRAAFPVLRHRLIANYHAEADKLTTDDLVQRLLAAVPK